MSELAWSSRVITRTSSSKSENDLKRDAVYEALLLDIICGDLAPGQWVDEAALSDRYRAGRAGVRDALFRLSLEGLVQRRSRVGTVVTSPSFFELQQIFELRVQIEGHCAALAALHAKSSDIAHLKAAFVAAEDLISVRDWRALVQCDQSFHRAMAAASGNHWIERTLVMAHNSALRFWFRALASRSPEAVGREIQCHRKVAEAIERRDPKAAAASMRTVLGEFPATVQGLFSEELEFGA